MGLGQVLPGLDDQGRVMKWETNQVASSKIWRLQQKRGEQEKDGGEKAVSQGEWVDSRNIENERNKGDIAAHASPL